MSTEPESLILQLLRQMRAEMATKEDLENGVADLRSEMTSLRADVASDLLTMQTDHRKRAKS